MPNSRQKVIISGLTKAILLTLGAGAVISVALLFPGLGFVYKELKRQQWEKAKKRGVLRATIRRLEKQQLVLWKEVDGELRLTLEEAGKKKILQYQIETLRLRETARGWDGFWRVIIFDVPESQRAARDLLRKKLKELGFYQLQKSVFLTRYECKDEIDFLRHALEIAPHVLYIQAKDISGIEKKV